VGKSKIDVAGGLFVLFGFGKWINIRWIVLHTLNFVSPWKLVTSHDYIVAMA
jgi:hypothetical protein